DEKIARSVGRFVHAILLGRIARASEFHACPVLDTEPVADLLLDQGDGIGDGTALLERRITPLYLAHLRRDVLDILGPEVEIGLHLASVSVTALDRIAVGGRHSELGKVDLRWAFAAIIGARGGTNRRDEQAHENTHLSH